MSKLYKALQAAQEERLATTNEFRHTSNPNTQNIISSNNPLSSPKFNDESELRSLAQNIAVHLPNPDQNVIQFIGPQAGEGTSTLVREFAIEIATHSTKPVLLVEADFHRPSQGQAFGIEATAPLDFALKEGKALDGVTTKIGESNLFLASLSSHFFRSLTERSFFHSTDMWKAARHQFSLILIDSPPVNASSDGLAICETVNGIILVLAGEKTRAAVAKNVKKQILNREGNLLGIVYTKRKAHLPESIDKLL